MSLCTTVAAIGLHLASIHSHKPTDPSVGAEYNNTNPGVYVQTGCGVTAGVYYNSIRKVSGYVSYTYDMRHAPIFLSVGAVSGYNYKTPVVPMGMVGLYRDVADFRLRIGYIPRLGVKLNDTHVVHLMIERRF